MTLFFSEMDDNINNEYLYAETVGDDNLGEPSKEIRFKTALKSRAVQHCMRRKYYVLEKYK